MKILQAINFFVILFLIGCAPEPIESGDKRTAEVEEDGAIISPQEITGSFLVKLNIVDGTTNQPVPDAIVYQYGFQTRQKSADKNGQLTYEVDPNAPAETAGSWPGWIPALVVRRKRSCSGEKPFLGARSSCLC